jgi:putative transcriptional regulator
VPATDHTSGGQTKQHRETSQVSQAVFAAMHNTSLSTVQKWEIGQKRPTGTALKLLHLV